MSDVVLIERRGDDAALLLINRPKALNALNPAVIVALGSALDRLAAEGLSFRNAFCPGATCVASRAAIFGRRILRSNPATCGPASTRI